MDLALNLRQQATFGEQLPRLAPWMHPFKFGPNTFTGYYKYQGLDTDLTWVTDSSAPIDITRLRAAYEDFAAHDEWTPFLQSLFRQGDARPPGEQSALDIGAGSGRNSLLAAQAGFGMTTAVEIRENQSAQLQWILDGVSDAGLRDRVRAVHEPLSADDPAFGEKYAQAVDVALSLGLLYHLANPWQHLINLRRIVKRRAIVYTLTHQNPLAKQMWFMTPEAAGWITKAVAGVGWTPHYFDLRRLCLQAGFSRVTLHYAPRFAKHFPRFNEPPTRRRDVQQLAAMMLHRSTGLRIGAMKNQDFEYFRSTGLNPNYFAYVCEV